MGVTGRRVCIFFLFFPGENHGMSCYDACHIRYGYEHFFVEVVLTDGALS